MNQLAQEFDFKGLSIPHARGDEPLLADYLEADSAYSPRTWG